MTVLVDPRRVKVTGGIYNAKVPEGAVHIGRAWPRLFQSPFANPWCVKAPGKVRVDEKWSTTWAVTHHRRHDVTAGFADKAAAHAHAVAFYHSHLEANPELVSRAQAELRGKDLACWCKPDQPCHGDILLELVNPDLRGRICQPTYGRETTR